MQFDSYPPIFDSFRFSPEHPFSPEGQLFTYYPELQPNALHYHDFLELGYCEWGSGLFYVDGEVIPFTGPCCSIIYGGQIHIAQSVSAEKSLWHFLYIDLKNLFSGTNLMLVSDLKAMSTYKYDFPVLLPQDKDPMLYHLCKSIMKETAELNDDYLTAIRGLVATLLSVHSRYMAPAKTIRKDQEQILARLGTVLSYINSHYTEDVTIDQLTHAGGLSKSTLQRDLIAFTGMAPMQYIHHLRMKRATILLAGDCPIASVAFDVGYNSLSSFNRHFLDEFGLSPSEWKKQNRTLAR